jgi:DNA-binding transcriptional LysR family regulator
MTDLEPEESLPALKIGELDLVVTYEFDHLPEPADPGVERHLLVTEQMYVAVPADDPRATGPVRIADFRDDQWIVGRDGSPFLEVQLRVAAEAGFSPHVDLQSNDYQVILAAVSARLGVALVPPLGMFASYPDVRFAEPADTDVHRRIVAAVRKGSSKAPVIAAAIDALREAAAAGACEIGVPER